MANKTAGDLIVLGTSDGKAKIGIDDLAKILSGADPSKLGADVVIIKLNLPEANPGAGILWADGGDGGTVKIGS